MHANTDVFGIKANLIPKRATGALQLFTTMVSAHSKVDHGKKLSALSAAARLMSSLAEATGDDVSAAAPLTSSLPEAAGDDADRGADE